MLKQARLPLHCLDTRICASPSGEEFGLRLAERGGYSTLGPVALLVREQATVGAALEALARYIQPKNRSWAAARLGVVGFFAL